jgi:hypothetical protein
MTIQRFLLRPGPLNQGVPPDPYIPGPLIRGLPLQTGPRAQAIRRAKQSSPYDAIQQRRPREISIRWSPQLKESSGDTCLLSCMHNVRLPRLRLDSKILGDLRQGSRHKPWTGPACMAPAGFEAVGKPGEWREEFPARRRAATSGARTFSGAAADRAPAASRPLSRSAATCSACPSAAAPS